MKWQMNVYLDRMARVLDRVALLRHIPSFLQRLMYTVVPLKLAAADCPRNQALCKRAVIVSTVNTLTRVLYLACFVIFFLPFSEPAFTATRAAAIKISRGGRKVTRPKWREHLWTASVLKGVPRRRRSGEFKASLDTNVDAGHRAVSCWTRPADVLT